MPRDPLAWLPLLQHWTRCLGEGGDAIPRMGDLGALPDLDMAALLPGEPGLSAGCWSSCRWAGRRWCWLPGR